MNNSEPIAALEIGTSNTVIGIGEPIEGGRIRIAALERIPSSGVRKSQIIDVSQARFSIDSVLKRLSEQSNYSIAQAYLVISGPQIRTKPVIGQCTVQTGTVQDEDLDEVLQRSYETGLSDDREAIEIARICYRLDDIDDIAFPKGMTGRLLSQRSLCIHGSSQRIQDARAAANLAKLEIMPDAYFAGICAAKAVLTAQHKRDGALVIDLGGGSTAYTAWADGHILHAAVLGVGGDHVTMDIRTAFSISKSQAETIKVSSASATITKEDASQRVAIPDPMPGFASPSISQRALNSVVNARMQEIFTIIREKLDQENILHKLNAGIFLTGGGSSMKNIVQLASRVFGCNVCIGTLVPEIEGLEEHPNPASLASMAGVLLIARNEDSHQESAIEIIKKALGRLFK